MMTGTWSPHRDKVVLAINYSIVIYAVVLPLGYAIANIVLALMVGLFIVSLLIKKPTLTKEVLLLTLAFSSYLFTCFFSLLYTDDMDTGLNSLLRKAPMMFIAIFLFFNKESLNAKYIERALLGYTLSMVFVCLGSLGSTFFSCLENEASLSIKCISEENLASSFISYHKLYFSLYITVGIYFANYRLFTGLITKWKFVIRSSINVVLVSVLILLASRTQLAISIILLVILPQILWFRKRKYRNIILSAITLIFIVGVNLKYNPILVDKLKEAINYNDEYNIKKRWGGASVRKLIWEYTYYVIRENPVFGVGIGDAQQSLNKSYENCTRSSALKQSTYNAHNEMLQILVNTGLFGLLTFLFAYFYIFAVSFRKLNYFHCGFILIFFLSGLTEAYLERDMGVRVFSFFSPLLFSTIWLDENTTSTQ